MIRCILIRCGLLSLVFELSIGCSSLDRTEQVNFVAFDQPQQDWPTRRWGFMHLVDGFPIYELDQLPPEPYEVRGIASVRSGNRSASGLERAVVRRARDEGGEAAVLTRSRLTADYLGKGASDYLVIQFKTNALASVLDRINVYLALNPQETNQLGQDSTHQREELEKLRQAILTRAKFSSTGPVHTGGSPGSLP